MIYTIFTDGASRGNPGHSGIGAICFDENGKEIFSLSDYIGEATNNVAEYSAVIAGLKKISNIVKDEDKINVKLDSELVQRQLKGVYKVKDERMKKLHSEAKKLIEGNNLKVSFEHVVREKNVDADRLANEGIDNELLL